LLVDGVTTSSTISWEFLQNKLSQEARIVCLSPFDNGLARRAHLLLPTLPLLEDFGEIGPGPDDPWASYSLAVPLRRPKPESLDPAALVLELASATTPWLHLDPTLRGSEDWIRSRVAAIHATGRGHLFDPAGFDTPLRDIGSAAALEAALRQGSCWIDEAVEPEPPGRFSFFGHEAASRAALRTLADDTSWPVHVDADLHLCPFVPSTAACDSLPPLLTKLVRDSELVPQGGTGFVHPGTARSFGIDREGWARIETQRGDAPLLLRFDAAVPTGIVYVAISPDPGHFGEEGPSRGARLLDLCEVDREGTWRLTAARLSPAWGSIREERS
jgi:hypothetical protein